MNRSLSALLSGTVFGAGLAVAQMTNPAKVLGFLDVAGAWDPSLAFVMGAALLVSAIAYRIRGEPMQTASGIDGRLLTGACLFGLGWGLAGFCPGPAVASLVTGSGEVVLFVASMVAGMGLYHLLLEQPGRSGQSGPVSPHREG
jgi:uncharacterized membrane protein YedE/YeeE